MGDFEFGSNDLAEFFSAVSAGKKKRKIKKDVLVGEAFDNLFWDKISKPKQEEKIPKKDSIKEEIIFEQEDIKSSVEEFTQPNFTENPKTKNSDPLTPLDQEFLTIKDFNNHYKLFLNRVQQQLSTLGGGGETRLEFLDDVDRNSAKTDNYFLKYNSSLGKWVGDPADGVGITSIISITGITSFYQATKDDDYIGVNSNVPVIIELPSNPDLGKKIIIKDEGNKISTYNITVRAGIGVSVENDTSLIMKINHQSFTFFYNGQNWYVI